MRTGVHAGEVAAIGVERQSAARGGVELGNEGAGLAARSQPALKAVPGTRSSRP